MAGTGGKFSCELNASRRAMELFERKILSMPRFQVDFDFVVVVGAGTSGDEFNVDCDMYEGGDIIDAVERAGEELVIIDAGVEGAR
jgi:hypothetical protein